MPYVTPPAMAPSISIRAPEYTALRPVNSDSVAPTPNSVTAVRLTESTNACGGCASSQGASGRDAPGADDTNELTAAPTGGPRPAGLWARAPPRRGVGAGSGVGGA